MSIDFQQVREQVVQLGESAPQRERERLSRREQATQLLQRYAQELELLRSRVQFVLHNYDPHLRCALPIDETLNARFSLPVLPSRATIIAADGSQINLDRHAEVQYGLINLGAIEMRLGSEEAPQPKITSQLIYDEQIYTLTEALLALKRDLKERTLLADLVEHSTPPVITFTDGPMELWSSRSGSEEELTAFREGLAEYLVVLERLQNLGVITAGYVDKPGAALVVRLLEVMQTPQALLGDIKRQRPFQGIRDIDLYWDLLKPGERSAVFALQAQSVRDYNGALALHFFYLNVGRAEEPWLARVEIPAWVAADRPSLDCLHSVLVEQCSIMGVRPYPYLLHRAHETAVVSLAEQEQVSQMIVAELLRREIGVEGRSYKQVAKDLRGRSRYRR